MPTNYLSSVNITIQKAIAELHYRNSEITSNDSGVSVSSIVKVEKQILSVQRRLEEIHRYVCRLAFVDSH